MIGTEDVFRLEFSTDGSDYELRIIPSNSISITATNYRDLPPECLLKLKLDWSLGDYPFGVISPQMEMEFDLNVEDSNLDDLVSELKNPTDTDTISGETLILRTTWVLYKDSELLYAGVTDFGSENEYDSKDFIQSISTIHLARYALEQFKSEWWQWLAENQTFVTPTVLERETYIDFFAERGTIDTNFNIMQLKGQTGKSFKDKMFWFYRLDSINTFFANVTEFIISKLLRKSYTIDSTLYNEGETTDTDLLTIESTMDVYRSDYAGGRGTQLTSNGMIYLLGAEADDTYANRATANKRGGFIYDLVNEYKTTWDLYVDTAFQFGYVMKQSGYFYERDNFLTNTAYEAEFIEQPEVSIQAGVVTRVKSSLVESYADDIDNIEAVDGSSRTDNSFTVPIVFNNYVSTGDGNLRIGYYDRAAKTDIKTAELFSTYHKTNAADEANKFALYYIDNPGSKFNSYQMFKIHHYFNLDWFGTNTEYVPTYTDLKWFNNPEAIELQLNSCMPKILSEQFLAKFSDFRQTMIKGKVADMDFKTVDGFEYDLSILQPPNRSIFATDFNKYFPISKTVNLVPIVENEIEGLAYEA